MLDGFEILTTSGIVLWSKSYAPVSSSIINGFIRDVFIEEKVSTSRRTTDDASAAQNPAYKKDQYTLKWASVKDLGLIFVAVYQSLLHLTWIDKLLDNIRIIFVDLYKDQVKNPQTSVVECDFDDYFDQQVKELEGAIKQTSPRLAQDLDHSENEVLSPPVRDSVAALQAPQDSAKSAGDPTETTSIPTPNNSRPSTPGNHILAGKPGPKSRRARKGAAASTTASSGDEKKARVKKDTSKKKRRWDADGMADEDDGTVLDYSANLTDENSTLAAETSTGAESIDSESFGIRNRKGQYVLKDLDSEVHSILQDAEGKTSEPASKSGLVGSSFGAISGLFRNVIGGKVLTKEDLAKPMKGMEEHLLNKNVAREAAVRLCQGVERELIGVKTGSFESVETTIRTAMESSLRKILTPTTSLDILHSITSVTSPSSNRTTPRRPYVISIVGVNGVGKSTNLSKLAFFLLQNNFSLLLAACDTFRSGAVEQLRVHARNLADLSHRNRLSKIELFEKGYGKDAANIAKDAVAYATAQSFDVVLIDTAGRRHNDTRLMSNLEKFGQMAKPDKILMVGEALVGSDSVAQARNFNAAFGARRGLDGFIISKCDTVGDMVGSLVSMVHATGIPVVFLGVGQHYGDLRTLNVSWAVNRLMS